MGSDLPGRGGRNGQLRRRADPSSHRGRYRGGGGEPSQPPTYAAGGARITPPTPLRAARAALNGEATALPKTSDGPVECIRMLRVVRRSAVKARTQAANQLHALVVYRP